MLTFGVCLGLVFATCAIFVAQTILFKAGGSALVNVWVGRVFFITWLAYALICLLPLALRHLLTHSVDGVIGLLIISAIESVV